MDENNNNAAVMETPTTSRSRKLAVPPPAVVQAPKVIQLERLREDRMIVPVIGITPLIHHKWSEKVKARMLADMQVEKGKRTIEKKREPKDPQAEADAALYQFPDGRIGFKSVAFKAAMVGACRFYTGLTMIDTKTLFFIEGEVVGDDALVEIFGEKTMREDTPRVANGATDLRYRYQIWPWRADLSIRYLSQNISADSIVALVDGGGRNGVGEWRPNSPRSHTGTYGMWQVDDERLSELQRKASDAS
jgi:hypothetical protein